MKSCEEDQKELFMREIEQTKNCLDAPNMPITLNYKKENINKICQGDIDKP